MVNHDNETCEEYLDRLESAKQKRKRDKEDKASAKEVKRIAKECPGCGAQIQKTSGCDHMTCESAPPQAVKHVLIHNSP